MGCTLQRKRCELEDSSYHAGLLPDSPSDESRAERLPSVVSAIHASTALSNAPGWKFKGLMFMSVSPIVVLN